MFVFRLPMRPIDWKLKVQLAKPVTAPWLKSGHELEIIK